MELAVPLVALGGLYVASNQEKKKEGYENMGKKFNDSPVPPPVNYPKISTCYPKQILINIEILIP